MATKGAAAAKPQVPATAPQQPTAGAMEAYAGYAEYAGRGFEHHTKEDYALPFVSILQAIDTERVVALKPHGGEVGDMFNSVTNEVYKHGVEFIPAATQHLFVEWKLRKNGGGFVGQHDITADVVVSAKEKQKFGEYMTPEGNELNETFYVWGIVIPRVKNGDKIEPDYNALFQGCIAFTSTKIKKYRGWMSRARGIQIVLPDKRRITLPIFAHRYSITSAMEKNTQGTFGNFVINFAAPKADECRLLHTDELFQQADGMARLVEQGAVKAAYETQACEPGDERGDGKAPF